MAEQGHRVAYKDADRLIAIIVVVSAVASAMLVLRVTDAKVIAGSFGAAGLMIAALLLAFRHLYPRETRVERGIDWSLVRMAADQNDVAIAITDRGGRIVCANPALDAMFGGTATPPGLPVDGQPHLVTGTTEAAENLRERDHPGGVVGVVDDDDAPLQLEQIGRAHV